MAMLHTGPYEYFLFGGFQKILLKNDNDGFDQKHDCKYRTDIGILTYFQDTSRPEIYMAVH